MIPTLHITATPTGRGRYTASLGDRVLCHSSATPFLSSARVLMAEGADPKAVLTMSHAGSAIVALRQSLGIAADLTVTETERDGIRFAKHRTFEQTHIA